MRDPRPPWRRLLRIAIGGIVCGALVLTAGRIAERVVIGADDDTARQRVQAEVRATFNTMASSLQAMAQAVADPDALTAAAADDPVAARRVFDAAEAALKIGDDAELALTAYAADGTPIAWAGRPSELPTERIQGNEAWFFAQSALGLRLVYLVPVTGADGRRIGAIASERTLSPSPAALSDGADMFVLPSGLTPVSLELNFENARTQPDTGAFDVATPKGDRLLTASVASADLARTRQRWRQAASSLALITLAIGVLLLCGPLLDWRNNPHHASSYLLGVTSCAVAIITARLLCRLASPADWSDATIFSGTAYASPLFGALLTSPFDFVLTAMMCGGLVSLALFAVEELRLRLRHRRLTVTTAVRRAGYALAQIAAGGILATLLVAHFWLIRDTIANATVDVLHFSLHPWNTARVAMHVGLIVWHATVLGTGVLILRTAAIPWRVPRHGARVLAASLVLWSAPLLAWLIASPDQWTEELPLLVALVSITALALTASRLKARYRHGSQAFRITMLTLALVVPAFAFYPAVFELAWQAKTQLVESRYAPQALQQRQTIQAVLESSLQEIDRFPGLADLISVDAAPAGLEALTDRAFQVWRITGLADYPVTSSVELYGAAGTLVSRYAFNLPDDLTTVPRSVEQGCTWDVFEEVAPFFAEERRVIHAGRAVCVPDPSGRPRAIGSIVVHAVLDYANLPFIASQNPYVELLRPPDPLREEGLSGRDVEYAVYGWSGTPLYASGERAWSLTDDVFARMVGDRTPIWVELRRGDQRFDVYLLNDRGGIYALGFPAVSSLDHLVNLAELTVLAAGTYLLILIGNALFAAVGRTGVSARALLREVRASFYRRLFLAFVAAAVVPVVALAVATRTYVADRLRSNVEQEAIRTAGAARRIVEDLVAPRAGQQGVAVDDNLMVWVSRLIDQDVNIFRGPRLLATSERNLFASGLLPTRTPADVYRALTLRNEAASVIRERIGTLEYLVAATPVTARLVDATLTVPLTAREQDIEAQIDTLNRLVLLGALLFILAGAAIGYSMAERIADPINRLTRATRRIARGDLDAVIGAASSDELGRLVEDFNSMAADLQRQRQELERTHRLEAWAQMAAQVAHEIKNPLTPIQLNAEHLRRVHADKGSPLSPVLEECVATILSQVKLLRQIASEFSNFASSPTAKAASVDVGELLREIVEPYRGGLIGRIDFRVDVPATLPRVHVDRTLVSRAVTNIVENALHAMPGRGTLTVVAHAEGDAVRIRVSDTGVGMDDEALARAFEPYFSTKATGSGLGLPIAKRNIELNGGTLSITSARDRGTTVEIALPLAEGTERA